MMMMNDKVKVAVYDWMDENLFMGPREMADNTIDDLKFYLEDDTITDRERESYADELDEIENGIGIYPDYIEASQADHWAYRKAIGDTAVDLEAFVALGIIWENEKLDAGHPGFDADDGEWA